MENEDITKESCYTEVKTRRSLLFVTKFLVWAEVTVSLVFGANAYIRLLNVFAKSSSFLLAVGSALLSFQVAYVSMFGFKVYN